MTEFGALTHPGGRDENQDAIGWDAERQLWLVADGMGGHASGQMASRLAKETILEQVASQSLPVAILKAHEAIRISAAQDAARHGMGSTVVCARFLGADCQVVWVGDSRAYLWRRGALSRLTRDHSYLELLRETENLSETALREHPNSSVVLQALGMDNVPEPSEKTHALRRGDWIILCSDGLPSELRDEEIADTLSGSDDPKGAAQDLLDAAIGRGGRDNISIIVVQYDGQAGKGRLFEWLALLGGVALAVVIVLLWKRLRG
jgi:PPM family protein phosphatase